MSDGPDDTWPPCMDFDNPGPHVWTVKRCGGCGKLEPLTEADQACRIEELSEATALADKDAEILRQEVATFQRLIADWVNMRDRYRYWENDPKRVGALFVASQLAAREQKLREVAQRVHQSEPAKEGSQGR